MFTMVVVSFVLFVFFRERSDRVVEWFDHEAHEEHASTGHRHAIALGVSQSGIYSRVTGVVSSSDADAGTDVTHFIGHGQRIG